MNKLNKNIRVSSLLKKVQKYQSSINRPYNNNKERKVNELNDNLSNEYLISSSPSISDNQNQSYQEDTIQAMNEKEIETNPKKLLLQNLDMLINHLSEKEDAKNNYESDNYVLDQSNLYKEKKELQNQIEELKIANNELAEKINNISDKDSLDVKKYKIYLKGKIKQFSKENIKLKNELNSKASAKTKIQYYIKSQIKNFEKVLREINHSVGEGKQQKKRSKHFTSSNEKNEDTSNKHNSKVVFEDGWSIPNFSSSQYQNGEDENYNFEDTENNINSNVNNGMTFGSRSKKVNNTGNKIIHKEFQTFLKSTRSNNSTQVNHSAKVKPSFGGTKGFNSSINQKAKTNRSKQFKY